MAKKATGLRGEVGEYTSARMHKRRKNIVKKHMRPTDWVIHADSDQFHELRPAGVHVFHDNWKTSLQAQQPSQTGWF